MLITFAEAEKLDELTQKYNAAKRNFESISKQLEDLKDELDSANEENDEDAIKDIKKRLRSLQSEGEIALDEMKLAKKRLLAESKNLIQQEEYDEEWEDKTGLGKLASNIGKATLGIGGKQKVKNSDKRLNEEDAEEEAKSDIAKYKAQLKEKIRDIEEGTKNKSSYGADTKLTKNQLKGASEYQKKYREVKDLELEALEAVRKNDSYLSRKTILADKAEKESELDDIASKYKLPEAKIQKIREAIDKNFESMKSSLDKYKKEENRDALDSISSDFDKYKRKLPNLVKTALNLMKTKNDAYSPEVSAAKEKIDDVFNELERLERDYYKNMSLEEKHNYNKNSGGRNPLDVELQKLRKKYLDDFEFRSKNKLSEDADSKGDDLKQEINDLEEEYDNVIQAYLNDTNKDTLKEFEDDLKNHRKTLMEDIIKLRNIDRDVYKSVNDYYNTTIKPKIFELNNIKQQDIDITSNSESDMRRLYKDIRNSGGEIYIIIDTTQNTNVPCNGIWYDNVESAKADIERLKERDRKLSNQWSSYNSYGHSKYEILPIRNPAYLKKIILSEDYSPAMDVGNPLGTIHDSSNNTNNIGALIGNANNIISNTKELPMTNDAIDALLSPQD